MKLPKSLLSRWRRHRYTVLLISLLVSLALTPIIEILPFELGLLRSFLLLNLVAALLGTIGERRYRWLLAVSAAGAVLMGVSAASGSRLPFNAPEVVSMVVIAFVGGTALREVVRRGAVDSERIAAALSVYILAGVTFAAVYTLLEDYQPLSFAQNGQPVVAFKIPDALYFSFVTLATLGYGDIVPVTKAARALAVLEAVGGQLYMVVLVARLISLWGR
jgi:hypothetical protein